MTSQKIIEVHSPAENESLWGTHVDLGETLLPAGDTFGPRLQRNVQLVILYNGDMTVKIDGAKHQVEARSVFILLPGHVEHFSFSRRVETLHGWLHVAVPPLSDEMRTRLMQLPRPIPLSRTVNDLFQNALGLKLSSLPTAKEILKAVAAQILWQYIGEAENLQTGKLFKKSYRVVECAQNYIDDHLSEPITLKMIADHAMISESQLIRLFHTHVRSTPIAYLWQQRITVGIELLKNTGLPVGVIAHRCGFRSSYHFSRCIRDATGMPPTTLRHETWYTEHLQES